MSDKIFSPYLSSQFYISAYDQDHSISWLNEDILKLVIPYFDHKAIDLARSNAMERIKDYMDFTLYRMQNDKSFDPKGLESAMKLRNLATLALCCTENVYYVYEGSKVKHVRFLDLDKPTMVPYSSDESAMSFTLNKIYIKNDEYFMESKSFLIHPKTLKLLSESDWFHNPMYTSVELNDLLYLSELETTGFTAGVVGRFIDDQFNIDENIPMKEYLKKLYEYRKNKLLEKPEENE